MRRRTRWTTAAGVVVTAALAVTGSSLALASSPKAAPTISTKPTKPSTSGKGDDCAELAAKIRAGLPSPEDVKKRLAAACTEKEPGKEQTDEKLAVLANRLGVSTERLENALRNLKLEAVKQGDDPTDPAVIAAFARDLGISADRARAILEEFMAKPEQSKQAEFAATATSLAARLGITQPAAETGLRRLAEMGRSGGADTDSPEFAALARHLGVPAERLAQALDEVKRGIGKPHDPPQAPPTSKPTG